MVKGIKDELSEDQKAAKAGFYKGYDIKWLKGEPNHPDFRLVEEAERKFGDFRTNREKPVR